MAIQVNTNVSSLMTQRVAVNQTNQLTNIYNRLASGNRINSAKDDAAGLQISDRLLSQIAGLFQGNRGSNDGLAFAQTAEGAMDEMSGMLQQARSLAVQAANGTNTAQDRQALQTQANQLFSEIDRIAQVSTYGGKQLLAGATADSIYGNAGAPQNADGTTPAGDMTLQVGANAGDTIDFSVDSFQIADLVQNADAESAGVVLDQATNTVSVDFSSSGNAQAAIGSIDAMIAQVDSQRSELGAIQNRLDSTINNQSNVAINEADARSRIYDTDYASETSNMAQRNILEQAAIAMMIHARNRPQSTLQLLGAM